MITAFSVGITILNQRIIWKDDIEFVTEFPCLLGHPVQYISYNIQYIFLQYIYPTIYIQNIYILQYTYNIYILQSIYKIYIPIMLKE